MPARIPIETYPLYSLGAALNTENIKSIQKSQDDRHPPATCTSPCCSVSDWKSTSSAQAPVHWMGLVKIRPTVMYWYSKFNVTLVGWLGLGRLYPPGRCPFGKQRPYQSFPVSTAWMRALCYLCFSPALGFITYAQKLDTGIDPNEFLKQHCIQCHGEEKQKGDRRFDSLGTDFSSDDTAYDWQEILDMLNLGEMPPEEEAPPH